MNQQTPTQTPITSTPTKTPVASTSNKLSAGSIAMIVVSVIVWFLSYYGAAKLSYDKYGSFWWALLAFIFAPFYYLYYAYFVSSRSIVMTAGRRIFRK